MDRLTTIRKQGEEIAKLKQELRELKAEQRKAKAYRDFNYKSIRMENLRLKEDVTFLRQQLEAANLQAHFARKDARIRDTQREQLRKLRSKLIVARARIRELEGEGDGSSG